MADFRDALHERAIRRIRGQDYNRAREVYQLLGIPERIQFVLTGDGHHANGPAIDPAWRTFLDRWLKQTPVK